MLTGEGTTAIDPASLLGQFYITIGVVNKLREREKRKLNLIFYNLAEFLQS